MSNQAYTADLDDDFDESLSDFLVYVGQKASDIRNNASKRKRPTSDARRCIEAIHDERELKKQFE